MTAHPKLYHSYLLRIWNEGYDLDWRASLQDIANGETRHFASMTSLLEFLQRQTEAGLMPPNELLTVGDYNHIDG